MPFAQQAKGIFYDYRKKERGENPAPLIKQGFTKVAQLLNIY